MVLERRGKWFRVRLSVGSAWLEASAQDEFYYSAELEATYRIVAGPDAVTLETGNNMPVALRLTGPDVLRTPQGIELRPVRDSSSRITGLTIGAGRVRDLAFIKR